VLPRRLCSYEGWRWRALSRPQAPLLLTVMAEAPLSSSSLNEGASACAATGVNRQSSIRGQGRAPREGRDGHVSHTAAGKTRDGAPPWLSKVRLPLHPMVGIRDTSRESASLQQPREGTDCQPTQSRYARQGKLP
jgi:hypothetical protein